MASAVDLSNSVVHEEAVLMTQGFRPDFTNQPQPQEPDARFVQAPFRTMKTKKYNKKKKKKGKRVLKRVYYEGTSQQSSYSSLMSSYVDIEDSGNGLELNSNVVVDEPLAEAAPEQYDPIQEMSQEDSNEAEEESEEAQGDENYQSSPNKGSEASAPVEENVGEPAHRIPIHNSPRESFKVFNQ